MSKPLNYIEALQLFKKISSDQRLHLEAPETGCFARAEIICGILKEAGLKPKIVQTKPQPGKLTGTVALRFAEQEKVQLQSASWNFHVAAAAEVQGLDGKTEDLVFDPAMLNGPETIEKWAYNIKAGDRRLNARDVDVFEGEAAKRVLAEDWKQSGYQDSEQFFKAHNPRFPAPNIMRFPSSWLRQVQRR